MEISRFIWVPVTTDQFCLVHLILKKNIMQFRTGKHHQAICDSFLWITLGEFREWKKHIPRNSQSHLADRGFRCHLPPGLLENPMFRWIFPQKKVPSSGIFQPRLILQKTGKCPKKSPWFTVNHRYSPVLSMIYHYIFTIIDRYWPLLTIINYY